MKRLPLFTLLLVSFTLTACNLFEDEKVKEPEPPVPALADTARNVFALLPATTAVLKSNVDASSFLPAYKTRLSLRADSGSAAIKPYAYFDLDKDSALASTADTTDWDIAFLATTIRINGSYQVVSGSFDTLSTAPESGYTTSGLSTWYDYSGEPNHTITPKGNMVIIIKTAGNKYAKLQITSYYKGVPLLPNGLSDTARYYSFKYFVQKDGSRKLATASVTTNLNTFFSFRTNQYTDTASQWDIALAATKLTFNGQFQVLDSATFDSVKTAPASGYSAVGNAAWYDYNFTTNIVTPKAGKVIVFKTADNKYGKIQILSYYKNNPLTPSATDTARYYTFKYFIQNDGSTNLQPGSDAAPFTYYSFRAKATVPDSSAGWDLAFRSTSIKVNGSSQLVTAGFDTLSTAPTAGYAAGDAPTWYDYSGEPNHTITPKLAKVLVVKTADNKYAKVEILSYYQGAPAVANGLTQTARYYTFRFVFQADGTTSLK